MSQNLSSAAVVIGALKVKYKHSVSHEFPGVGWLYAVQSHWPESYADSPRLRSRGDKESRIGSVCKSGTTRLDPELKATGEVNKECCNERQGNWAAGGEFSHGARQYNTKSRYEPPFFTPDRRQSKSHLTIDESGSKFARSSVFDCHLSPVGRQKILLLTYSKTCLKHWQVRA